MKNYIKDIYLLIIFLFAAMACSDNEELIKKDEPGEVIPPVVVEPVTVLDEHFDDKNKYLTSGHFLLLSLTVILRESYPMRLFRI